MSMKTIEVHSFKFEGKKRLMLKFPYDKEIITLVRTIPGARWDPQDRIWHIASTQGNLNKVVDLFMNKVILQFTEIERELKKGNFTGGCNTMLFKPLDKDDLSRLEQFIHWMKHKRYCDKTIKTYSELTRNFLRYLNHQGTEESLAFSLVRFTNEYILPKGLSFSYQNQLINALKLFYREVLERNPEVEKVQRPRREYKLPNVLSKAEVKKIIEVTKNLKHKTILSLIYACGLRRSEALNLLPKHIDSRRGLLVIINGKGRRDRMVPLSEKMVKMLRDYYLSFRPERWLFEGIKKGTRYDERSLEQVMSKAVHLAGIKKPATLHWLRHSYATHLHESGVDIHMIQLILGHKSSKTTEIYTHVSTKSIQRVRSPFDDL